VTAEQALATWLVRTTLEGSVLILLVFLARRLLGKHLSPRSRAALWLLVVARLALPMAPASPASVFNIGHAVGIPAAVLSPPAPPVVARAPAPRVSLRSAWSLRRMLLIGWAGVAVFLVGRLGLRSYRLSARVGRQRALTDHDILETVEDVRQELGVRAPVSLVVSEQVETPALMGFVRPRLLLPGNVIDSLTPGELRLVFMHELAHIRRRDVLAAWGATAVHVLHWFNPLVGYALARMRADRELATDSLVLSRCTPEGRRSYGEVLIRLLEMASAPGLLPGTVGVLEDGAELKRRVTMIAGHAQILYRRSLLATAVVALMALTTFTRAQAPATSQAHGTETGSAVVAAEAWLATVDDGEYGASWDEASGLFRQAVTRADWVTKMEEGRKPLGVAASRTVMSAVRRASLPGMPDGEYVVITTNASFAQMPSAIETCTMRQDDDGSWRAAGYFVRPASAATSAAEEALASWLALLDAGRYAESWDASSSRVKAAATRNAWIQQVRAARAPLGALLARNNESATPYASLPNAGEGPFVVVTTASSFEHKSAATETCTLVRDQDGRWRVAGYFIR
jgi:beta-lactamase regulating signal transducer with metallopeptidase domain